MNTTVEFTSGPHNARKTVKLSHPPEAVNIGVAQLPSGTYRISYDLIEERKSESLITMNYTRTVNVTEYLDKTGQSECRVTVEGEWETVKPAIDVQAIKSPMALPDSLGSQFLRR